MAALLGALLLAGACSRAPPPGQPLPAGARVLAVGDSLTYGAGAPPDAAWPAVLSTLSGWHVLNLGVNGDTTARVLQRVDQVLADGRCDAMLVGIGGNDMLRNVPTQETQHNLAAIVQRAKSACGRVAVIATPQPTALRAATGLLRDAAFYSAVAEAEQVLLLPEVYAGVLSDPALRSDRIHANAQGYARVASELNERLREAGW
jgi:acyl-CoA thioesterase-1